MAEFCLILFFRRLETPSPPLPEGRGGSSNEIPADLMFLVQDQDAAAAAAADEREEEEEEAVDRAETFERAFYGSKGRHRKKKGKKCDKGG